MTATLHVDRRTVPHHPLTALRQRWDTFQLRHFRRVQAATFQRLHDALPLDDAYRYAMESPALEAALQRLAVDHAEAVTPADGGTVARDTDREQLLLAACDAWFRDIHGPEHTWNPRVIASYDQLMDGVRGCFHLTGGAA